MKVYTILEHIVKKSDGTKETRQQFDWYRDKNKLIEDKKYWLERDMSSCLYKWDNPKYEILEKELENMEFYGLVDSYGDYEDHTVIVGDTNINGILESLYKGSKVKVTIEFIE